MNTKNVFFPCAGKGTRMGEIGKRLPKPLWPLFESTLLEVQMSYAVSIGLTDSVINVHHLKSEFDKHFLKSQQNLKVFHEKKLLGSGGCFHNLKAMGMVGDIYIFNPDSFLLLHQQDWQEFFVLCSQYDQVLIAIPCKHDDDYNRLVTQDLKLQKIVPPGPDAPTITYSGFGKINLSNLHDSSGESGFFQTVAKLNSSQLVVFTPKRKYEFWDFGTLEDYKKNISLLLGGGESELLKFLRTSSFIDESYLGKNQYKSQSPGVINLSPQRNVSGSPGIYLSVGDNEEVVWVN